MYSNFLKDIFIEKYAFTELLIRCSVVNELSIILNEYRGIQNALFLFILY